MHKMMATDLPLMEAFFTVQGEGYMPVRPPISFVWRVAMWAVYGAT
jgi:hypothetical protein